MPLDFFARFGLGLRRRRYNFGLGDLRFGSLLRNAGSDFRLLGLFFGDFDLRIGGNLSLLGLLFGHFFRFAHIVPVLLDCAARLRGSASWVPAVPL